MFKKCDVRGKCFIEYIPAERAWAPVSADGYMYIDYLWVSGQFKGQGYSNLLLEECLRYSREKSKKGLVILSSRKKLAFLSDPSYLKHKGFVLSDEAAPYFQLYYLPFAPDAEAPRFLPCVGQYTQDKGFVVYYARQCPFTAKYVPLLEQAAREHGAPFRAVLFEKAAEAQSSPCPYTSFSLFYDGQFITHEIPSPKKFLDILVQK